MIYLISPLVFINFLSISDIVRKKLNIKDGLFNFFILTLIFPIIYVINSYLFIINLNTKIFTYFCVIFFFFTFILNFKNNIYYLKKIFYFKKNFIFIYFFFIYLLTQFPAFEEDSLRYHLPIAKKIINQTFYENTWFDYIAISAHEFLNVFFLNLNIETGSALINFFYLIIILIFAKSFRSKNLLIDQKKDNEFFFILIFISSPYLLSLLTSQKLYILPCFIAVFTIVYLYLNYKNIKFNQIFFLSLLSTFNIIIKITFLPYTLIFFIMCFFVIRTKYVKLILYNFIFFIILYFPLTFIKFKIYHDPFIPLISINENNFWFKDYLYWLSSFNMDITDKFSNIFLKILAVPIKIIFPLSISDIFKTLGVGVLYFLTFDIKNKKLLFLGFLFFISPFLFFNLQTRWFLPFLIFVMIFANLNKFPALKILLKFQTFVFIILIIALSTVTIISKINRNLYSKVVDKFSNSYHIVNELNNNYPKNKIYTSLNNFYYFDNFVPIYFPKITLKFDKDYFIKTYKKNDLILWEERPLNKKIITTYQEFITSAFNCKNFELLKKYSYNDRRFFLFKSKQKLYLIRLKCSDS